MKTAAACISTFLLVCFAVNLNAQDAFQLSWKENFLTITGKQIPGESISIMYLEAFCKPGSTARDWSKTVIPHKTRLVEQSPDGKKLRLESLLDDGVIVGHEIKATPDSVDFKLVAKNPTDKTSLAHWAQPCMRVDKFTGVSGSDKQQAYLSNSFIFLNNPISKLVEQTFLNKVEPWAMLARYTPGQVWAGPGVPRNDVNPRPLSSLSPSNGLIGCVSADRTKILAMAWEPYQELFQGVVVCLHSDFRIGGLAPGESRTIHGKIYVVENDPEKLLARYHRDFSSK